MDRPLVVVANCVSSADGFDSQAGYQDFFRKIVGDQANSDASLKLDDTQSLDVYPINLKTKYYTAEVGLCSLSSPTIGDRPFADAVEAVILYFVDNGQQDFISRFLTPWLSFVKHWDAQVQLLTCAGVADERRRHSLQKWCLDHEYELVVLDPDEETVQEAEECCELIGVARILQALQAHSWSNLTMRDEEALNTDRAERLRSYLKTAQGESNAVNELANDLAAANVSADANESASKTPADVNSLQSDVDRLLGDHSDQVVYQAANTGDGDEANGSGPSFEELFSKFAEMRQTAANLPEEQRRAYAEQVTMAFWKAIGGDDDEIEGLESADDDEKID